MELEHRLPTPFQARLARLAQILRVRRRGRGPHPRPHSEGHRTGCAPARFLPHTLRPEALAGRHGKAPGHYQRNASSVTDPRKFKAPCNPKERIWPEADALRAPHPAGRSGCSPNGAFISPWLDRDYRDYLLVPAPLDRYPPIRLKSISFTETLNCIVEWQSVGVHSPGISASIPVTTCPTEPNGQKHFELDSNQPSCPPPPHKQKVSSI